MNIFKLISQIDSQKDLSDQQLVFVSPKKPKRSPLVKFLVSSSSGTLVIKLGLAATFLLSTTEIAPAQPPSGTVCYVVSDGSSPDRLIQVDINTGVASNIGSLGSGITNVEAIAYWPITGTLYGANANRLGTINTSTGTFTPVGTTFGSGSGSAGSKNFNDVDGITFDPHTGELYGSVRDGDGGAPEDLLIKINPATGAHIPDAFGSGVDYLVIRTASVTGYNDVDDITIDPDDGQLYGIANQGSGSTDRFVRIDRTDGTVTQVGSFGLSDVEGMNSFNDGSIYLSAGNSSGNNQDDRFYQINKTSGSATEIGDLNSLGSDFEGIACLTGAPNTISGTVFFDDGGTTGTPNDGILNGDEAGNDGVTVRLFRDRDSSGTVTAGDIPLATQVTSGGGNYSFVVASTGDFVLEIDQNNIPAGQALTTDNLEVANFGVSLGASDTGNNFGHGISPSLDYGDAPDTYGTDDTGGNSGNSSDPVGANHVIDPNLFLGATAPDADSNGFVDGTDDNGNASDDDLAGTDDEDDLTLPALFPGAIRYTIPAANITATNTTGQAATLHAWIDFDNSGTFEATEHTSVVVNDGTNGGNPAEDLTWDGITAGAAGNTYARFRLTTDNAINNTTPGGAANDGEVEDYQIAIAPGTIRISGTVFEDMNYGGGAGRNFTTAEASATASGFPLLGSYATATFGARVELYSYDGIDTSTSQLIQEVDTDGDGNYLFEDDSNGDPLPSGHYLIRVVNDTIISNRDTNFTGEIPLAVQTFRHDPDETAPEITNEVGGAHPAEEDPSSVFNFGDPLPSNAQSVTAISGTGEVNNVDFGFNFDTIVNTNVSGQGSLRQFLNNSKELQNDQNGPLDQDLPGTISAPLDKDGNPVNLKDYETSIFMIPDPNNDSRVTAGTGIGQVNLTNSPPDSGSGSAFVIDLSSIPQSIEVSDDFISLDGRTQSVNIPTVQNSDNFTIDGNETTGPEIILRKTAGEDMIEGLFDNLIFHSLGIFNQTTNIQSVGLQLSQNSTDNSNFPISQIIMEDLTIAASNCGIQGVRLQNSVIRNSVIRDSGRNRQCNNIQLRVNSSNNLIEDNFILRSSHYGIQIVSGNNSDNIIRDNTIVGNGVARRRNITAGIGLLGGTNTTIVGNSIYENIGDGITITNDSRNNNGNLISQNSIYNNGDLGIDLGLGRGFRGFGGDGVSANDAGDGDSGPNLLQNFPVINNIISDGTDYTIEGSLETTPNTQFNIELYSNAVCNPDTSGTAQSDNYGEGEKYHDTMTVTTDSSGQATFSIPVAISDLAGNIFTTTATATSSNNTSEFSQCFGLSPDLLLVKRITAINPDQSTEIQFNNFVDDGTEDDNNVNWLGFDNSNQTNTYTLGEIDGGLVKPGDEVEYTIYFLSSGSETAQNVLVCDLIPENMEFISQSFNSEPPAANGLPGAARGILWQYDGNIESLTDGTDGDAGYYFPPGIEPSNIFPNIVCDNSGSSNTNGAVVVNLGNLPGATDPGTPTDSYGFIRFRAQVK